MLTSSIKYQLCSFYFSIFFNDIPTEDVDDKLNGIDLAACLGICSVLRWAFHRVRIESSYINALCIIHWSCRGKCDHCFVSQLPLQLCVPLRRLLEGLWSKSNVLMVSACSHVSSELCLITIFTKSDRVWFVNTKHPIVFPFSQSCLSIGHSPPPSTRFFFTLFLLLISNWKQKLLRNY